MLLHVSNPYLCYTVIKHVCDKVSITFYLNIARKTFFMTQCLVLAFIFKASADHTGNAMQVMQA